MARDASGALKGGGLEAANRAEALEALKSEGLSPVSLAEGPAPRGPGRRGRFTAICLGSAALALLFAGYAAWRHPLRKEEPGAVATVKAGDPARPKTQPPPYEETEPARAPQESLETPGGAPAKTARPDKGAPAPVAKRAPLPGPPSGGQAAEPLPDVPDSWPTGYSSGADRVINMIVNAQLGNPPPPLLQLPPGEDVAKALSRDILLFDDDDEKTRQEKENVAHAKQLLREYLGQGGTPETFLRHYHGQLVQAFDEWREAQKTTTLLLSSGEEKAAGEFIEAKNRDFLGRGIRPVMLPPAKK